MNENKKNEHMKAEIKKDKEEIIDEELAGKELDELKKKADERDLYYNKWLTVHAEYENTRKRMEKEKNEYLKFANEDIIFRLFMIVDNFDMAMSAMEKAEDKTSVIKGITIIQKEFHKVLEENGVERIETKGQKFDPYLHEAVGVVETTEVPDGVIVDEIRSGYTLNKRLLRAAQVRIAKNSVS